jgi:hypothetical protein
VNNRRSRYGAPQAGRAAVFWMPLRGSCDELRHQNIVWKSTPEEFAFRSPALCTETCACGEEVALLLLDKRPQSSSLIVGWKVAQIRYRYRHRYRWSVSVSVVHHVLNVLLQSEVDLSTTYTNEAAVGSSITRDQQLRLVLQIIETPDSSSGVS